MYFFLGVDEAGGDIRGVDVFVGIFVDFDVGSAVAGVGVTGIVE